MPVTDDSTNEELVAEMLTICKQTPGNSECMDCGDRAPKWAVVNWGIVVCIRCSGHHRNMGVHISKVKSVNLDKWTPDEVRWMARMGNTKAKECLEAKKRKVDRPTPMSPDSEVSLALKMKYAELKYRGDKKPPTFKSWMKREEKRRAEGKSEKKSKKEKKEKKRQKESESEEEAEESSEEVPKPKEKKKAKESKKGADLLSFFDTPAEASAQNTTPTDTAPRNGHSNGNGNGNGTSSPTPKRSGKAAAAQNGAGASESRGAFGNVTGDAETIEARKNELLSLFS